MADKPATMARTLSADPQAVMQAVETEMGARFDWADGNCALVACRAFQRLWGIDLTQGQRVSTVREALRLVKDNGGAAAFLTDRARLVGLVPCGAVPGAIGLLGNARRWSLAINVDGRFWAAKSAIGLEFIPADITGWGVPCSQSMS